MNFLRNLLKRLGDNYINFFKNYLVTNIIIIISTVLEIIFMDTDLGLELFKYELFFTCNSFTVESFIKNKKFKLIGFIMAYIVAFTFGYLFNNYEDSFANFFVFYLISLPSINLFNIIKKDDISNYLHQLFSNLVSTTIINIVLNIGVFAILGIITSLLIPDIDFDIFLRVELGILGFYTIPAYLYAFVNKDSKITELANILLKFVILPLTFIALLVVYLYLFKIVITANMPSNSVFAIVLLLFIESMLVFALFNSLKIANKVFNFIANNITFIFIPLYILQAYAMILRVATYGLTKERYLGLMVLFVEAFILFLLKFKNRKYLNYTLYLFVIVSFITFLAPILNYEDASINYQVRVVEKILKSKKISELNGEEKAKLVGAYTYLKDEKALERLSIKVDEEALELNSYYPDYNKYFKESFNSKVEIIDISKYSKLQKFSIYENKNQDSILNINGFKVELSDVFQKLINGEKIDELIYKLDEENDLYIIDLYIDGYDKEVNYYSIDGYILTK